MNANVRRTAATLVAAIAAASALTAVSVIAPPAANAHRPGPSFGSDGSTRTVDFAVELAQRKARWAQYYADALGL
jgi:hypothetical protein